MKKIYQVFILLFLSISILSCNNPLHKKYNDDHLKSDLKEISESKKIDSTDAEYMAMYIVRAKMLGEKLEDQTYADILSHAKELRKQNEKEEREQKVLAAKAAQEEKIKSERFDKVLTVALYHKGYQEGEYQNYLTYDIAFQNKSAKGIRAFKGQLKICDLFDSEIKTINLTIDDPIAANSTYKSSYTTEYNQFSDEDKVLQSKDLNDLKTTFICEKIIFDDGTILE